MKNPDLKVFSKILTPFKASKKSKRLLKESKHTGEANNDFSLLKIFLEDMRQQQNNSLRMYNREVI